MSCINPMTAVKGLVSMMLKGDYGEVTERFKQPLTNVYRSSERQIHLINDLLTISRLQTGRIKYQIANFALDKVTAEIITSLNEMANHKKITLSLAASQNILVHADEVWVKEILTNLIENAIKFYDCWRRNNNLSSRREASRSDN